MFNEDLVRAYVACYVLFVFLTAGVGFLLGRGPLRDLDKSTGGILTTCRNTQAFLFLSILVESFIISSMLFSAWLGLPDLVIHILNWCAVCGGICVGAAMLIYALVCGILDGLGIPRQALETPSNQQDDRA